MKKSGVKFASCLALASTLAVGLALGSLGVASASSRPGADRSGSAHSSNIQFSGRVSAYTAVSGTTAGSITLTDRAGATLTFSTSTTTTITQIEGSGATLSVNDFATVQAPVVTPSDASSITFSAAAPVSFSGIVTAYTAPSGTSAGSITLVKRNAASLTYSVTSGTIITENGGGNSSIAIDDFASVQAAAASPTVALTIAFDAATPIKFDGRVIAYTPASGTVAGSITLKNSAGAELTFAVWSTTTITENGGSGGELSVGDHATVQAAASAKTDAVSITYVPAPPIAFYGLVTAYTAASGATPGSITLEKKNSHTATFSTTSTTAVTEVGGSGDTLAVGDYANVIATSALPTTAHTIRFTPSPRPVYFSGRVTAYTAPSGATDGSITVRRRDRATLTYSVTSSTIIAEVDSSGDTIAVRDPVTVEADAATKTVATKIYFKPAAPVAFAGRVTAYTPASGATAGSLTLVDRAGASLTFATSSTTTLTQVGGSGATLGVGDFAIVRAAANAKTDALIVDFSAQSPIVFSGRVSAYMAPSGSTEGSLTLERSNGASVTYSVTSSTTITEINGIGDPLATGDYAVVVALASTPTIAATITYRIHR
jgi:mucin-19